MNAILNKGLKALVCGTAAVAITAVMSAGFIQSTDLVHNTGSGTPTVRLAKLSVQPAHTWFGQPKPAVLVD